MPLSHHKVLFSFATVVEWNQVEDALHFFMSSSHLDDLVKVVMPPRRVTQHPSGPRSVPCANDFELLQKLLIGRHVPLAAPLLAPKSALKAYGRICDSRFLSELML